jgi:polar amino acid transport system substrate-binding protein
MGTLTGAAALAVALIGAGPVQAQQQDLAASSVLEEIKKRGTLRVGMSTFVPWAMRSKEGDLVGFEIDVATKVAEDMGAKVEFVPTAWSGAKRNLTVNFTIPYAHSGQQMAANKALAGDFTSLKDFNKADVTIACRRGATPCQAAQKIFPKAQLRRFDDDAQAFQEVINGNAHATISSGPKPTFWTLQNPDKLFMPTKDNLTTGDEAFALRKGDPDAINFFSNWIQVNTSNGWLKERHDFWFKTQEWAGEVALKQ